MSAHTEGKIVVDEDGNLVVPRTDIYGDDTMVANILDGSDGDRHHLALCWNMHPDLVEALRLHAAYEAMPADRGGKNGPKGRAWTAFITARDTLLARIQETKS